RRDLDAQAHARPLGRAPGHRRRGGRARQDRLDRKRGQGARVTQDEVLDIFRECGALLEGHFILSSGLRSPVFLQKARVFMYPDKAERRCRALAEKPRTEGCGSVSKIVSPAIGGIIPGYETARHLGVPALYTERVEGRFELRRGFELGPGERVLVVEDIVTTGLSIRECIEALRKLGADVVAAACLVDRSAG